MLFSTIQKASTISTIRISRLNHFDVSAYGLLNTSLTLNACRYLPAPKVSVQGGWAAFPWGGSAPPATVRLVAHLKFLSTDLI